MANPETGTAWSRAELEAAFELVKPNGNWKYPIDVLLPGPMAAIDTKRIRAAVIFFTGSVPTFREWHGSVVVQAAGYYAAIGS